jgi:hypothetical protein
LFQTAKEKELGDKKSLMTDETTTHAHTTHVFFATSSALARRCTEATARHVQRARQVEKKQVYLCQDVNLFFPSFFFKIACMEGNKSKINISS